MKKLSFVLAALLLVGMLAACGGAASSTPAASEPAAESTPAESTPAASEPSNEDGNFVKDGADVTLYSSQTTNVTFAEWLKNAEEGTGLSISVIAAPTNSDTRQQKITTVLSSGDSSIDLIEINDEMAAAFKNTGWLEPVNEIIEPNIEQFATGYIEDMITSRDGDIVGIPGYQGYLSFWVNQEILDEVGMTSIDTKDDFIQFVQAATDGNGRYGYGGAWEKTYVFNEIATFVNLFGGDYLDWTNPNNKEAMQFLYDMANTWEVTPKSQFAEKYEQLNQRFIDGKVGCQFMWGTGYDYDQAGMLSEDKIHMALMPEFTTRSIFTDSWCYVLNAASEKKAEGLTFLEYTASVDGYLNGWENLSRYPARKDAAADPIVDSPVKEIYTEISEKCVIRGRPMLPQTMEFITDMGTIFQSYIDDKMTLDDFCEQAQTYVETYQ